MKPSLCSLFCLLLLLVQAPPITLSDASASTFASPLMVSPMLNSAMTIITQKRMVYELASSSVHLAQDRLLIQGDPVRLVDKWPKVKPIFGPLKAIIPAQKHSKQYLFFFGPSGGAIEFSFAPNRRNIFLVYPHGSTFIASTESQASFYILNTTDHEGHLKVTKYSIEVETNTFTRNPSYSWKPSISLNLSSCKAGYKDGAKFYVFCREQVHIFGEGIPLKSRRLGEFFDANPDGSSDDDDDDDPGGDDSKGKHHHHSKHSPASKHSRGSFSEGSIWLISGLTGAILILILVLIITLICKYSPSDEPAKEPAKQSTETVGGKVACPTASKPTLPTPKPSKDTSKQNALAKQTSAPALILAKKPSSAAVRKSRKPSAPRLTPASEKLPLSLVGLPKLPSLVSNAKDDAKQRRKKRNKAKASKASPSTAKPKPSTESKLIGHSRAGPSKVRRSKKSRHSPRKSKVAKKSKHGK